MLSLMPGLMLALVLFAPPAFAHGVITQRLDAPNCGAFCFHYSSGEPLAYAEVKVFGPGNDKLEFQNGRADAKGCFSFLPDRAGEWRISIKDGMGHHAEGIYTSGATSSTMKQEPVRAGGMPQWLGVLLGVGLIFLIFPLLARLRRGKP